MVPKDVGLADAEYDRIVELLGRVPNDLELGLFGVLWSEHCSYKNSKSALRWLPHDGPWVVSGPGGNAGVVRLTDQWDVAFKVESHNHPSYVEPVQGAATGVGGIIRDVVAMGARPVALMDSLRFGTDAHAQALEEGVVEGVGRYGNAIGIPTVGGEIYYGPAYSQNPLVNVLCVGLKSPAQSIGSHGARAGAAVFIIGQKTGRDGIHGASLLASQDFGETVEEMRPTVQVGDPFTGKLLMEATLAAIETGCVQAVQDLGAAGLTSSSAELAVHSGVGIEIDVSKVPCREDGMTPYEIMLSETQERMLLIIDPADVAAVRPAIAAWELELSAIGQIVARDTVCLRLGEVVIADVPATVLVNQCPIRPLPSWRLKPPPTAESAPPGFEPEEALSVLHHPDCRSRFHIASRYDWMIQTRTVWGPTHDSAVLCLAERAPGLIITLSGVGRWAAVDPYAGGAANVSRVASQLALQNAEGLGLTDGLNCGNPERDEVYAGFLDLVAGIRDAATAFALPVTGGNVSFHNETEGRSIWPTGVIGAVGRHPTPATPRPDVWDGSPAQLLLFNPTEKPQVGGSIWELTQGTLSALPRPRLKEDAMAYRVLRAFLQERPQGMALRSVHDGGVFAAMAKMLILAPRPMGFRVRFEESNLRARLFNEEAGQILLVATDELAREFAAHCREAGVKLMELGHVVSEPELHLQAGRSGYRFEITRLAQAWRGHCERTSS